MKRLLLLCAFPLLACKDSGPQIGIYLQVYPTVAAVGDTITFVATAAANSVTRVHITYGDASSDSYDTGGISQVQATFQHVYADTGTYQVRTTATAANGGTRSTGLSVTIQ